MRAAQKAEKCLQLSRELPKHRAQIPCAGNGENAWILLAEMAEQLAAG
jgi:hypothetical protein